MADSVKPPVAIRITRPYANEDEMLAREVDLITRTGIVLVGAQSRPAGVILRFEVVLATGTPALRGEGRVVGYKENAFDGQPGLALRFTRLDTRSKALVDRAAAMRDAKHRPPLGWATRSSSLPPPATPVAPEPPRAAAVQAVAPPPDPPSQPELPPSQPELPPPQPELSVASSAGPDSEPPASDGTIDTVPHTEVPEVPVALPATGPRSVPPEPALVAAPGIDFGTHVPAAAPPAEAAPPSARSVEEASPTSAGPASSGLAPDSALPASDRDALLARLRERARGLDDTRVRQILGRGQEL